MKSIVRISAWVMLVMGVLLALAGALVGEWGRAGQGALFVALGLYFLRRKIFERPHSPAPGGAVRGRGGAAFLQPRTRSAVWKRIGTWVREKVDDTMEGVDGL